MGPIVSDRSDRQCFACVSPRGVRRRSRTVQCPGHSKELLPRPNPGRTPVSPRAHMVGMPKNIFVLFFGFLSRKARVRHARDRVSAWRGAHTRSRCDAAGSHGVPSHFVVLKGQSGHRPRLADSGRNEWQLRYMRTACREEEGASAKTIAYSHDTEKTGFYQLSVDKKESFLNTVKNKSTEDVQGMLIACG